MRKIIKKGIKSKKTTSLTVINFNAGGLDIGDKEIVVSVPADRDEESIRTFGTFTCDLHDIANFLIKCKVNSVAMESTGVYWVPLYLILEDYGIEVYLVNAKHVKNVTGRKDDEEDAEWIQKLHSCGLLKRSFQPDNTIRTLRNLVRHRQNLLRSQSSHVNRMIKTMELMNIKLHTVISDILGKTGMSTLKAIIEDGVRDPEELSKFRDRRIKATKQEIIKSLEADWREEYLFELKHYYDFYYYYQSKIEEVSKKIEDELLNQIAEKNQSKFIIKEAPLKRTAISKRKNEYEFNVGKYLEKITGVDPTEIFGINGITALNIFSEIGTDLSKWKTSKHFTSWLALAPNNKITAGKIISSKIMKKKHMAGQAFRMGASTLWNSKNELGDFYRRIRARNGPSKAVVATARKLATIYYLMMTRKEQFNPKVLNDFQQIYKQKKIKRLKRQLADLEAA
jgi:transposase